MNVFKQYGKQPVERYDFGEPAAKTVLIQMVDDHDLGFLENEIRLIREMTGSSFRLTALKARSWNDDLSPWPAPAVFGKDGFAGGAEAVLEEVTGLCGDKTKTYIIGGYSLAGLFALWSVFRTDAFAGAAAASPSVWFPGFTEFVRTHEIRSGAVYLSLGDREEKTRNPVMAAVGTCIRGIHAELSGRGVPCTLEWNEGNHFWDADLRTAKAFAWVMRETGAR